MPAGDKAILLGGTHRRRNGTNGRTRGARGRAVPPSARAWMRDQAINAVRHAAALRPFEASEFGKSPAAPSEGHRQATNALLKRLRGRLLQQSKRLTRAAEHGVSSPSPRAFRDLLQLKERSIRTVKMIERVWDFYLQVFRQRNSRFGPWLYVCDRIALDCYQAAYTGLEKARPVPTPPPFSYMQTGRSPATFRRGVRLRRISSQLNPFPLIQLPYHRLVNPWTLGAILHEVSHNLQNDLGLARAVPARIESTLRRNGIPAPVAAVWRRWNRETFADLNGLLLGGPAIVDSLLDVLGRGPEVVQSFNPRGVHPTPFLRAFLSFELLRRLGFDAEAQRHAHFWKRLYPRGGRGSIPSGMLATFEPAHRLIVDAICFKPFKSLGDRPLAEVIRFRRKDQTMIEEAAGRLAAGTPAGILPERYLIGAARIVLDRRIIPPGRVTKAFYAALSGGPR